jgi:outer membrane protein OmpA-like peptidoglycan-associated protein
MRIFSAMRCEITILNRNFLARELPVVRPVSFLRYIGMLKIRLIVLCLFMTVGALAQGYDPAAVSARARGFYEKAGETLMTPSAGARSETISLLKKALEADPRYLDAAAQLADLYSLQHDYPEAVRYYDQAYGIDSAYLGPAYLKYAKAEAGTGRFRKALELVDRYLARPSLGASARAGAEAWRAHFRFGDSTAARKISFHPVNLGDSINSPDAEYAPTLTIDQKTLIFTRNIGGHNEDFFISHLRDDSTWSLATDLGPPINSSYNEGVQTVSQDGELLMFTICNRPDGMGSCDIYYAFRTAQGWSAPRDLGPRVNSPYWDSQPCLAPDGRELYFVSNRPGGLGGSDIYVSTLSDDGSWGSPRNLGPSVNTPGDESSPFIHADGQTLYFASDGWPGLGGVDVFLSRANPDGSWGKPMDLGYPINTVDHDGSLFVAADGHTAYFASDRSDSRGKLDIYSFQLYPAARPIRTLFVRGYVYDARTGTRLTAQVDLVDLASGKTLTRISTGPEGDYLVTLPVGRDYAFNVTRQGYLFHSEHFSLKDTTGGVPFRINIGLDSIEVNARVTLRNIFFAFDEAKLLPSSTGELDKVVQLLRDNPTLEIRLDGYTDSVGTAAHNQQLSLARAEAVVSYLQGKGISRSRMSARGNGARDPVASNDTEQGRALNRRTELVIVRR